MIHEKIPKSDGSDEIIHSIIESTTQKSLIRSISMTMYLSMFDYTVNTINEIFETDQESNKIGILDIFGFENFKKNCFEQFCINFSNEKLQQQFAYYAIELKQKEYLEEGINTSAICSPQITSSLETCDTVITYLQEACRLNFSCDIMLQNLKNQNTNQKLFFPLLNQNKFCIAHFAENVSYEADRFIEKNLDNLKWNVVDALKDSTNSAIKTLFENVNTYKKNTLVTSTIATVFKSRLIELCKYMTNTEQHFVRCIKPNTYSSPTIFDEELIHEQIKYSGLTQICEIMRTEYPIKLDYGIYDHCFPHISDTNGIAFGKTKAFVTKNTYFEILQISAAIVLQSIFRQKIVEVHRKKQINAIYRIQYNFLTYLAKRLFKKHMKAIRIIQRIYKSHYSNRFVSIKDNYEELSKSTQTEYDIDTLQQQIQEQEILLIRAKRLIQLYDTHFYDPYLRTRSRNFLQTR